MAKVKLSKSLIDSLKPDGSRRADYFDESMRGFFLRVEPSGTKTFYQFYRNKGGRGRNFKLGRYGAITLSQARDLASACMYEVYKGNDPSADRSGHRRDPTVSDLAKLFREHHITSKLAVSTQREYGRLLDKRILPKLGSWKVVEISRADVLKWHLEMKETPREANHALAVLSKMLSFSVNTYGFRESNPCLGVQRFKGSKRERFLQPEEFARLGSAIQKAASDGGRNIFAVRAIQLLALSGCRRSEVLSLKWTFVDKERSCLHLPTSKTGKKTVPLGAPALACLQSIPKLKGSVWVFPNFDGEGHLRALDWTWYQIRKEAGLTDLRLHDLRHTFASVGASQGVGLSILGKALGQSQLATTQRYAHLYDDPVNNAVGSISEFIEGAMSGHTAKIIPLGKDKKAS